MVSTRMSVDQKRSSTDRRRGGGPDYAQSLDKTHRGSIDKGSRGGFDHHARELRDQRRLMALDAVLERPADAIIDAKPVVESTKGRRRKSITLQRAASNTASGGKPGKAGLGENRWQRWMLDQTTQALGFPASASNNIVDSTMSGMESNSQGVSEGPTTRRRAALDLTSYMAAECGQRGSMSDDELKSDGSRRPSHEWNFRHRRRGGEMTRSRMSGGEEAHRSRSIRMSGEEDNNNHFLPPELAQRSFLFMQPDRHG